MLIRDAVPDDAAAATLVLRRSITELCTADHLGRAERLEPWLANKTPENLVAWIAARGTRIVVAEDAGAILGVGGATARGEILLNYVSPDARFRGVSKAVLDVLEVWLANGGIDIFRLSSTATARQFYLGRGYSGTGRSPGYGGMIDHDMQKKR